MAAYRRARSAAAQHLRARGGRALLRFPVRHSAHGSTYPRWRARCRQGRQAPSAAVPVTDKAGLGQCRHFGNERGALFSGDCEWTDSAGGNVAVGVGNGADEHADMAAKEVIQGRAGTFIRHVRHFHPRAVRKELNGEMIECPRSRRTIGDRSCSLLADLISSLSEWAGKLGCTTMTLGVAAMSPIGSKSRRGS